MGDAIFEHPRLAAMYDELDPHRSDLAVYRAIADELDARRVLDVGCGTGTFALLLADDGLEVDLATMTGNVAQAIVDNAAFDETLRGVCDALRPGGYLVFETRDPAREARPQWTRSASHEVTEIEGSARSRTGPS